MTTQTSELAESQRRRQSEQSCIASASQLRGGVVGIHASFSVFNLPDPIKMLKTYAIEETFGIEAPKHVVIEGNEPHDDPRIPERKEYLFRREPLRDLIAFLNQPMGDGLYLTGPTGSGKTSLITQVAARLYWPVHAVTCHGRVEFSDLVGQFTLKEGTMQFVHGPLAVALREGHILVLNEIDCIDPAELQGLNDCLEGNPLVIPQHGGEIIVPHPRFRLIATANSQGSGDRTGLYQGVLRLNLAFLDRFRLVEIGYPDPMLERDLLTRMVPELSVTIREAMIRVANEIRTLFIGNDEASGLLTVTLSTRGLLRWAHLAVAFQGAPNAIEYALERALTLRAEPEQRLAIHRIAADVLGDHWP